MKQLKSISIRMRMTLLVACITIFITILVSALSSYSANKQFYILAVDVAYAIESSTVTNSEQGNDTFIVPSSEFFPVTQSQMEPLEKFYMQTQPYISFNDEPSIITLSQEQFMLRMRLIVIACVFICIVAAWFLSGLMVQPIRHLDTAVGSISATNLHARLPIPGSTDEIGRLTLGFNDMLSRLEADFERQKQYSSAVAHELKTPLATLKASMQVANMEQKIDCELYQISLRSIERLNDVVGSLLTLYQEPLTGEAADIALSPFINSIVGELSPSYSDRTAGISITITPEDPKISASPVLLHRLLANLIENALKYSPADTDVEIAIASDQASCTITVTNQGFGISADALPHIFEPFYREDESRSRACGGSGLGLSIVQTIADHLGYTVTADSTQGQSTIFTVFIPHNCNPDA